MPRAYKEYPPSYFSILERFEEDSTEMRIKLPARDAFGRRRDFYRLGDVLSELYKPTLTLAASIQFSAT